MMAYRDGEAPSAPREPSKDGLVADMVRQFADPYAFVRELVQNGIDAGASRMVVAAYQDASGMAFFEVQDDGCGMDLAVLEGPLLTLFNSGKERSDTIGQYGVGFVSVLALEPDAVEVRTWCDGNALRLLLAADYSYEIFDEGKREGSGSCIVLRKAMEAAAFELSCDALERSLLYWCRHAEIPIQLRRTSWGGATTTTEVRSAFQLDTTLCVASYSGQASYLLGAQATMTEDGQSDSFAGFYNRGLTLYETTAPQHRQLEGLRFKAMDAQFKHTLSRDNVIRDAVYKEALSRIVELVPLLKKELAAVLLVSAQAGSAGAKKQSRDGRLWSGSDFVNLLYLAQKPSLELNREQLVFPLVELSAGRTWASARELLEHEYVGYSECSSVLTKALAQRGVPVILLLPERRGQMLNSMQKIFRSALRPIDRLYTVLVPCGSDALTEAEAELCRDCETIFHRAGVRIGGIRMADTSGEPERAATVGAGAEPLLLNKASWPGWWRRFRQPMDLMLLRQHQAVQMALRVAAVHGSRIAAFLLTRYLLVEERGEVSKDLESSLLEGLGVRAVS